MNSVYDKVLEILWEAKKQGKLPFPERRKGLKRRSIKRGGKDRRLAFKLISKDTAQARDVSQERDPRLSPTEIKDLTAPVQKYFPWENPKDK